MKRKVLAAVCFSVIFAFSATACGGEKDKDEIRFKTLTVSGTTVTSEVSFSNATADFSFANEIEVNGNASYTVASDPNGTKVYETKVVPLAEGDNTFYILETVDGKTTTYTVTLRRKPTYRVWFITKDGSAVESQTIEEGALATEPTTTPIKLGYTFAGWDYDFSQPITEKIGINAQWTVNAEMLPFTFTSTATTCEIMSLIDKEVTSVTIPDYVTSIGTPAFYGCKNLESVTIPNSVTSIGVKAFYECSSMTSITIGEKVESIADSAFKYCDKLTNIIIPDHVTSIDKAAFAYCSKLTIYCEATSQPSGWSSKWNSSNCPVYWYSETEPLESGNYWHYVDGKVAVWE